MMVCVPWASAAGVKLQLPAAFAVVVPSTAVPSVNRTIAFAMTIRVPITLAIEAASPVPVSVSFEVILSDEDVPVSVPNPSVTVGAWVS